MLYYWMNGVLKRRLSEHKPITCFLEYNEMIDLTNNQSSVENNDANNENNK